MLPKSKCIIILSEKSSGSSVCHSLIHEIAGAKYVSHTRHFENETLFWTKAASILGLRQLKALDSEVPIPASKAKADLIDLLGSNIPDYNPPTDTRDLVFGGWKQLCETHQPIFLEKSPHHLFQWAALQLILECMEMYPEIDFLVLGLVRNPMDTAYSQFKRWSTSPDKLQHQWLTAYQNLLRMKELAGDRMVVVRYEDMVLSLDCLNPVFNFCGLAAGDIPERKLHAEAIGKWKKDQRFGFSLAEPVKRLARIYGYADADLDNAKTMAWPVHRAVARIVYKGKNFLNKAVSAVSKNKARSNLNRIVPE